MVEKRFGNCATVSQSGAPMPVSDGTNTTPSVDATVLAFGGVDLVVNNAGLSISKPLLETTTADWDLQHDVMARGSFLVAREAARAMVMRLIGPLLRDSAVLGEGTDWKTRIQEAAAGRRLGMIDYQVEGQPRLIAPEAGLAVYRTVQESITNVVRHAGWGASALVRLAS